MTIAYLLIGFAVGFVLGAVWMHRRITGPKSAVAPDRQDIGTQVASDAANAIADADRRMAHGAYQEAGAILETAIESDPGRTDLKAKLLEVLFVWGQEDEFLAKAESFAPALRDTRYWSKLRGMGEQLFPGHELFRASSQN